MHPRLTVVGEHLEVVTDERGSNNGIGLGLIRCAGESKKTLRFDGRGIKGHELDILSVLEILIKPVRIPGYRNNSTRWVGRYRGKVIYPAAREHHRRGPVQSRIIGIAEFDHRLLTDDV